MFLSSSIVQNAFGLIATKSKLTTSRYLGRKCWGLGLLKESSDYANIFLILHDADIIEKGFSHWNDKFKF